jgi:hypothetical protein
MQVSTKGSTAVNLWSRGNLATRSATQVSNVSMRSAMTGVALGRPAVASRPRGPDPLIDSSDVTARRLPFPDQGFKDQESSEAGTFQSAIITPNHYCVLAHRAPTL